MRGVPRGQIEFGLSLLREEGCDPGLIGHCLRVSSLAYHFGVVARIRGAEVDLDLVVLGGLLHDIGRSRTHGVAHGYLGGEILRARGMDEKLARVVERHVGAGIPSDEAIGLGLPPRDFVPETVEEKIVCYADKFVMGEELGTVSDVLRELGSQLGKDHPALSRFRKLHLELSDLLKGDPLFELLNR